MSCAQRSTRPRPRPRPRLAQIRHASIPQHDAPRADLVDEMNVVGRDHHGHAHLIEALEQSHDLERELRIEIAGGFIRNEQCRFGDDRPRDAHPLLLAGRELQGAIALMAEQADLVERRAHTLVDFALRHAGDDQRQRHVVRHRPVVQQFVVLEYHTDLAPELGDAARLDARRILLVDEHLTARGTLDEGDQFQDASLACARVAGQEGELAAADVKRHAGEGFAAVRVPLVDLVESNHAAALSGADFSSAETNSDALKTPKSSACSPTPTNRIGILSFCAIASTMPPFAVPSSFVTTSPVTPRPLLNSSACATAF
jgi:hypothetical protein